MLLLAKCLLFGLAIDDQNHYIKCFFLVKKIGIAHQFYIFSLKNSAIALSDGEFSFITEKMSGKEIEEKLEKLGDKSASVIEIHGYFNRFHL